MSALAGRGSRCALFGFRLDRRRQRRPRDK